MSGIQTTKATIDVQKNGSIEGWDYQVKLLKRYFTEKDNAQQQPICRPWSFWTFIQTWWIQVQKTSFALDKLKKAK